jgi:hypothetical protein
MQVPSVVFVRLDGEIVVGEAAEQQGAAEPSRVVREFKRRIGDSVPLVVGGAPFSAQALTARLLAWVVGIATERQGGPPEHVCVTHPANWGPFKRDLLGQAVEMAGLRNVETCTEPEAAAITYASRNRVAAGDRVAVSDLGGGRSDAAVLAREVGLPAGGVAGGSSTWAGSTSTRRCSGMSCRRWATSRGLDDTDPATATALARLRRDCVEAKGVLSFSVDTVVPVALRDHPVGRLTGASSTTAAADAETVSAMRRVLEASGVGAADVAAMVLVGGSSRIHWSARCSRRRSGGRWRWTTTPSTTSRWARRSQHPRRAAAGVAAPGDRVAARATAAAAGPATSGPAAAAPAAVPSALPPPPAWAGGPPPFPPAPPYNPADPFAPPRSGPDGTAPFFAGPPPPFGPGKGGPPPPPPGPSPDWRPPAAVGPHSTRPGAPQRPGKAASTGGSGRRRALAIGSGVVVALASPPASC